MRGQLADASRAASAPAGVSVNAGVAVHAQQLQVLDQAVLQAAAAAKTVLLLC